MPALMWVGQAEASSSSECNVVDDEGKALLQVQLQVGKKPIDARRNMNNIDEKGLDVPPGYKFHPSDRELIQSYLKKKVLNHPLPRNRIYDVNLYNHNPYDLAMQCKAWCDCWYFFTPRDRKYPKGKRPNRTAGDGYWKATGADKNIMSGKCVIGARKTLVFYRGKPTSGKKTDWIMHEYRIDGLEENTSTRTEHNMRLDDWVLCKTYERKRKDNSKDNEISMGSYENVDDGPSCQSPSSPLSTPPAPEVHAVTLSTEPVSSLPRTDDPSVIMNLPGFNHTLDHQPAPINVNFPQYYQEENLDYMFADNMFSSTPVEYSYWDPALSYDEYSYSHQLQQIEGVPKDILNGFISSESSDC